MGGIDSFNPRSNHVAFGWSNQPGGQDSTQVMSYTLTSSVTIPTNMFGMMNPPLSSRFTPRGGVGIGAELGFNATTTHQKNPNYRPF
jgi:hypothetical protein